MNVRLHHTEDIAEGIRTFWFEPPKPINYTAGQFIEMYLPHPNPDERGIKHWFTLSSSPAEPYISITTKIVADPQSTFKQTLLKLKPGDEVRIVEPMGDFVLPKDKNIPLLFAAGGMGITPMRSMVKWLIDTDEKRDITMLYAVSRVGEFAFIDLFKNYGVKLTQIMRDPPPGWQGEKGALSAERIMSATTQDNLIFISGPEPMVESIVDDLKAKGVEERRLVTDYFPGYLPV